jgi:hypothetical protein
MEDIKYHIGNNIYVNYSFNKFEDINPATFKLLTGYTWNFNKGWSLGYTNNIISKQLLPKRISRNSYVRPDSKYTFYSPVAWCLFIPHTIYDEYVKTSDYTSDTKFIYITYTLKKTNI